MKSSSIVVLTDSNTQKHCLPIAQNSALQNLSFHSINVTPGEMSKTLDSAQSLWNELINLKVDRDAILICLGGGVICDLGGYVASCYKRGMRTAYIPTTNLAMTDAAIGGKTGLNFGHAKNQIGTFHLPELILIDVQYLYTLPLDELNSGFAETVKHALVADVRLWNELITGTKVKTDSDSISRSANIKLDIIKGDLHDKGIRQSLNFGHTLGHALEAVSHNTGNPLLHGQAVFLGMLGESWISHKLGYLSHEEFEAVQQFLYNQTSDFSSSQLPTEELIESMAQDKKNLNGQIVFTLLESIGQSIQGIAVDDSVIFESIQYIFNTMKK